MKKLIVVPLSCCLMLWAQLAQAMSIRELNTLAARKKTGELLAYYYLVGVREGLLEANIAQAREGKKPSFCTDGRKIAPHMGKSLYQTELKRNVGVYEADMPVQLVMRNALISTYSCGID